MNWYELLSALALHLYGLGSVMAMVGLMSRNVPAKKMAALLICLAFALHSAFLLIGFMGQNTSAFLTRGSYLLSMAWWLVALGLVLWLKLRMELILLLTGPLALALFLAALALGQPATLSPSLTGPLFAIHLGAIFVGICAMALAGGTAIVFLWQERALKAKTPMAGFRKDLPALGAMDKVNHWATMIGFPLYSVGLLFGFIWAGISWGRVLSGDPKEWFSLLTWALYALLFHMRTKGWSGKRPAIMALALFAATLFSLLFINIFIETHHSFNPALFNSAP